MTAYLPILSYSAADHVSFLIRILVAAIFGYVVGYERQKHGKEPGCRTHCIIAATACTLMILSKYAFADIGTLAGSRGNDNARMAAQVISGVSFLCAAAIFKADGEIKGLTTAAGMWATAAIGLATGSGMYYVAAFLTLLVLILQIITHSAKNTIQYSYKVILKSNEHSAFEKKVKSLFSDATVNFLEIEKEEDCVGIKLSVGGTTSVQNRFFKMCSVDDNVKSITKF
ncbi:MAG: MgtC/SapB family protein [Sphaerochaetaceae bacterium]|nr:MgtC/SapB family protein [Sphaerochaetaceae bacterium]